MAASRIRAMLKSKSFILRKRRAKATQRQLSAAAKLGVVGLVLATVLLGALGAGIARLYLEVTRQVPSVEDIAAYFQVEGEPGFQTSIVVDRRGRSILPLKHPAATEQEWIEPTDSAFIRPPDHLIDALLVRHDPTFWRNAGYVPAELIADLTRDLSRRGGEGRRLTITEQLVAATLLPLEDYGPNSVRRDFRLALLSERLTNQFEKDQILTWYLNSAHFGQFVYGVDAAALAYYGKHADGLTLAESATLAVMAGRQSPEVPPAVDLRAERDQLLEAMAESGSISERRARQARGEDLEMEGGALEGAGTVVGWHRYVLDEVKDRLGAEYAHRGGLTIQTTIDWDLQSQASCVLEEQAGRLSGEHSGTSSPAEGGVPCLAAGLLPPLRPGQTFKEGSVVGGSAIVLEPANGELLALAGDAPLAARPAGTSLQPFIYLAAFSRGFSPGTMVLDLPPAGGGTEGESGLVDYHGPVRMRAALLGEYKGAAHRTVGLAGRENVTRTFRELGLLAGRESPSTPALAEGRLRVGADELATAYGVVANQGVGVGIENGSLAPAAVLQVEDLFGRVLYRYEPSSRVILSEALAYLLVDVLTDHGERARRASGPVDFDPGRLAGLATGTGDPGERWSIAFTPNRVVTVRLQQDGPAQGTVIPETSAAPISSALLQYASRDLPVSGWDRPPQVAEVEVCDPSGLLPTEHCPETVSEPFLQGTEPTAFDTLYQPVEVNRENGRLATLSTPVELVEERVYLVTPPEAAAWADAVGLEQPPTEYDPLAEAEVEEAPVQIREPKDFEIVKGKLTLRGAVYPEGLDYYRLQYGQGLNPTRWTQIGEDRERSIQSGRLGVWDTEPLSGLYTLQLVAVLTDGTLITDSAPITLDNQPPQVEILSPSAGELVDPRSLTVEAAASDDVAVEKVEFFLEGELVGTRSRAPYAVELVMATAGEHELFALAHDTAGNQAQSESVTFTVGSKTGP